MSQNYSTYHYSPKPNILDKEYFDYLQNIIRKEYIINNEIKLELLPYDELLSYKIINKNKQMIINGIFVNEFVNKICDWCNKSIQIKDLHNYYSCICKSESHNTIRQDMCKYCFEKFNEFIDNGIINNLNNIGITEILPYDDEYVFKCDGCNSRIHRFEDYYIGNLYLNSKTETTRYCKDCCYNFMLPLNYNSHYNFGSFYDWIIIGKSIDCYLLCNLNPECKYYKNFAILEQKNNYIQIKSLDCNNSLQDILLNISKTY